jgi:hypothetical protein
MKAGGAALVSSPTVLLQWPRAKERFSQELDLLPEKPNRHGRRLAAAA